MLTAKATGYRCQQGCLSQEVQFECVPNLVQAG